MDLEIKTINELKEISLKILPARKTDDNECIFCKKDLNFEKWCNCLEAQKVNWRYKKVIKKINYLEERTILEDDNFQLRLLNSANIPEKFKGNVLSDFKAKTPKHAQIKKEFEEYFNNSIENWITGKNLILLGNYGTGKTKLECILANDLTYNKFFIVDFLNLAGFIKQTKDSFSNDALKASVQSKISMAKTCDFLILDDVDKVEPTQYVVDFVYNIIDHRILKNLPIIISANSTFADLNDKYFGEAITSRIYENSLIIKFDVDNWRIGN